MYVCVWGGVYESTGLGFGSCLVRLRGIVFVLTPIKQWKSLMIWISNLSEIGLTAENKNYVREISGGMECMRNPLTVQSVWVIASHCISYQLTADVPF